MVVGEAPEISQQLVEAGETPEISRESVEAGEAPEFSRELTRREGDREREEASRASEPVADFPLDHLARLDEQLGRPKWVVPVRQDDDLERLLRASIKLCREGVYYAMCCTYYIMYMYKEHILCIFISGRDTEVEACQRFFREGLTLSFNRILTDDAVSTWKPDIQVQYSRNSCVSCPTLLPHMNAHTQRDIYNNTALLVELCVTKLDKDWFVLLELLALVFNPQSRYYTTCSLGSLSLTSPPPPLPPPLSL